MRSRTAGSWLSRTTPVGRDAGASAFQETVRKPLSSVSKEEGRKRSQSECHPEDESKLNKFFKGRQNRARSRSAKRDPPKYIRTSDSSQSLIRRPGTGSWWEPGIRHHHCHPHDEDFAKFDGLLLCQVARAVSRRNFEIKKLHSTRSCIIIISVQSWTDNRHRHVVTAFMNCYFYFKRAHNIFCSVYNIKCV